MSDFKSLEGAEKISVVGIGRAGCNILSHLSARDLSDIELVAVNSEARLPSELHHAKSVSISAHFSEPDRAGSGPHVGRTDAEPDRALLVDVLCGADLVVIVAALGSGTGIGAARVVAEAAKNNGASAVAVVAMPFSMEGHKSQQVAQSRLHQLRLHVDAILPVPNEEVLQEALGHVNLLEAYSAANNVVAQAVLAIIEPVVRPGIISFDIHDIRSVFRECRQAAFGFAIARGEGRARKAARAAIRSPYFEDTTLREATAILVNITADIDLGIKELVQVGEVIEEYCNDDAMIVLGSAITPEKNDEIRVVIIATASGREQGSQSGSAIQADRLSDVATILRRPLTSPASGSITSPTDLRLVVPESVSPNTIAHLVMLISDVYESVSTDRLIVRQITNLPPTSGLGRSGDGTQLLVK